MKRPESYTVLCLGGPYDKQRLEVPFFRDNIPDEIRNKYYQYHSGFGKDPWLWVWKDLLD